MGAAGQIVERAQYTEAIGGVDFVLRRPNPVIGLRVYGSKLFGLVAAVNTPAERRNIYLEKTTESARERHIKDMLRICMVSPRLGDETDVESDVISYDDLDLAGYAGAVFASLTGIGGDESDFSDACEDKTAPDSQETLTPSGSDTGSDPAN